jgi:hypothetical protein
MLDLSLSRTPSPRLYDLTASIEVCSLRGLSLPAPASGGEPYPDVDEVWERHVGPHGPTSERIDRLLGDVILLRTFEERTFRHMLDNRGLTPATADARTAEACRLRARGDADLFRNLEPMVEMRRVATEWSRRHELVKQNPVASGALPAMLRQVEKLHDLLRDFVIFCKNDRWGRMQIPTGNSPMSASRDIERRRAILCRLDAGEQRLDRVTASFGIAFSPGQRWFDRAHFSYQRDQLVEVHFDEMFDEQSHCRDSEALRAARSSGAGLTPELARLADQPGNVFCQAMDAFMTRIPADLRDQVINRTRRVHNPDDRDQIRVVAGLTQNFRDHHFGGFQYRLILDVRGLPRGTVDALVDLYSDTLAKYPRVPLAGS